MSADRALAPQLRWPATVVLGAFVVAGALMRHPHAYALSAAACVVAIGASGLLAARGPRVAVTLALAAGAAVALDAGAHGNSLAWFGLCVLALRLTIEAGPRAGLVFLTAAEALLLVLLLIPPVDAGWLPWMAGVAVSTGGAALIVREQELVIRLRAAQSDLAERSRAEERTRIARDLHDVIAHSLTVSLLHIAGARLALAHDPQDAARALEEAERLGRSSLDEVRSIVSLMRSADTTGASALVPVAGLEGIDQLVERFRSAGAEVAFERAGDGVSVPATAGAILYRIAQEAFTNAAKHAPGRALSVTLAAGGGQVELTVDSDGPPGDGSGMGLESMRARAEAVGGTCEAGPAGDGWRVLARVPARSVP